MGQRYKSRYNKKTKGTMKRSKRGGGQGKTLKAHNKNADNKFVKLNCSPENKGKEYTCYTDEDLHKLSDMWNARHPDKKITVTDPKQIWEQLKTYYSTVCNKESCWVRQMTKNTKMENTIWRVSCRYFIYK